MGNFDITQPATDAAKQWNGWGTALKPAHEPIVLARKPLGGTVAENVLKYGTGGLNIDGCRVDGAKGNGNWRGACDQRPEDVYEGGWGEQRTEQNQLGRRWPANVITDGSEEVLAAFPNAPGQQGDLSGHSRDRLSKGIFGDMKAARDAFARLDSGSAARFFYAAKASQEDRNEGCEGMEFRVADTTHKRPRTELDDPRRAGVTLRQNNHPTVKPTDLMRYLCRLVTPPNGIVLDPFCGSGSTGKAAMLEGLSFIGIELSAEYCELAEKRIAAVMKQGRLMFA
jgi:site-specific DNA-methyltransferase (adenine-specific)